MKASNEERKKEEGFALKEEIENVPLPPLSRIVCFARSCGDSPQIPSLPPITACSLTDPPLRIQAPARGNADNVPMELLEPILFQSATQMKASVGVGQPFNAILSHSTPF